MRTLAKQAEEREARGAKKLRIWTADEDSYLISNSTTLSVASMAEALSRSRGSVRSRIQRLAIKGLGKGQGQLRGPESRNWKGGKAAAGRRAKYGVDVDFDGLLATQGGVCAICGNKSTTKRPWHVDHDHTTGQIRGILCHHCNLLLGNAKDNMQTLRHAIVYLRR
jgi:Recombination endonuclease VII